MLVSYFLVYHAWWNLDLFFFFIFDSFFTSMDEWKPEPRTQKGKREETSISSRQP